MSYHQVVGERPQAEEDWCWEALAERCTREASRILRSPQDAQDAAQNALLRAWRQRHQCAEPSVPEPWVAQIARREALRVLERTRARGTEPLTDDGGAQAGAVDDPELVRLPARLDLDRVLDSLPARDRALAILHYSGDVSQAALAQALAMPEVSVRVRIHRLRGRLRSAMPEQDERPHRHRRSAVG